LNRLRNIRWTVHYLEKKIEEVGLPGNGLSINEGHLYLEDGKPVDSINHLLAKVEIGEPGWESAGGDVALKVRLEAHEFLSLMGLEHTDYYPISKDLVNELRSSSDFAALSSVRPNSLDWIRSQMAGPEGLTMRDFAGSDLETGRSCGLFFTNRTFEPIEDYYIVVGYTDRQKIWTTTSA
jgi:hypothetical protein